MNEENTAYCFMRLPFLFCVTVVPRVNIGTGSR